MDSGSEETRSQRRRFEVPGRAEFLSAQRPVPAVSSLLVLVFLGGAVLLGLSLFRPVNQPDWREADMSSIARNFAREGMNPFFPRIDWRGDGPGFAEMEFPFLPWGMAIAHRARLNHEVAGRILSLLVSLFAMAVFFRLALDHLSRLGALAAAVFYVTSPLVSELATKLQPEAWMMLGYILAIRYFARWIDAGGARDYWIAMAATSLAILAKVTAAHVGLLFVMLALDRWGARAFRDIRLWVFAVLSLLSPVLWYVHAHGLWLDYGNSLGVSNEAHWITLDLLGRPSYFLGILKQEARHVWTPAGLLLGALILLYFRPLRRARLQLYWGLSLIVYYLSAVRSTAHDPLYYYHVVSVPVAALTIGLLPELLRNLALDRRVWMRAALMGGVIILGLGAPFAVGLFSWKPLAILVAVVSGLLVLLSGPMRLFASPLDPLPIKPRGRHAFAAACVVLSSMTVLFGMFFSLDRVRDDRNDHPLFACALEFRNHTQADSLILASGNVCTHPAGGPAAYNASYMFYWMDRKGFNVCIQQQTLENVETYRDRGARYFVAEKEILARKPGFEDALRQRYSVIEECAAAILLSLEGEVDSAHPGIDRPAFDPSR